MSRKRITLATFRRIALAEETMMRALMPRCHANSPDTLGGYGYAAIATPAPRTFTATPALMATMKELAH